MPFDIPALGPAPFLALAGITLLAAALPLVLLRTKPLAERLRTAAVAAGLVLPCTAMLGWSVAHNSIALRDGQIVVHASYFYEYARNVADFDLAGARVGSRRALMPDGLGMRANGISLPGYTAGRFSGEAGGSRRGPLFVAVTDSERMLYLPARRGQSLLVSVDRGQELLDEIYRTARVAEARMGGMD